MPPTITAYRGVIKTIESPAFAASSKPSVATSYVEDRHNPYKQSVHDENPFDLLSGAAFVCVSNAMFED